MGCGLLRGRDREDVRRQGDLEGASLRLGPRVTPCSRTGRIRGAGLIIKLDARGIVATIARRPTSFQLANIRVGVYCQRGSNGPPHRQAQFRGRGWRRHVAGDVPGTGAKASAAGDRLSRR